MMRIWLLFLLCASNVSSLLIGGHHRSWRMAARSHGGGDGLLVSRNKNDPTSMKRIRNNSSLLIIKTSNDANISAPSYGLYNVQEEMLIKRGVLEEEMMTGNSSPLEATQVKGIGVKNKGFGSSSSSSSSNSNSNKFSISKGSLLEEAKVYANILRQEGVVRIDNVLSEELADQMRRYVFHLRQDSIDQIQAGTVSHTDRFADVLLRSNRCDLKIPLEDTQNEVSNPVLAALYHVFCQSAVKTLVETILSDQAVLYELSCLISDPGSQRQTMHPDNPWIPGREEPTLLTCFIALQDVHLSMGPTVFMPRTNTQKIHQTFLDESIAVGETESPKDKLLRTGKTVLGTLPKGSCSIYDSRLLHCGSANRSSESRAIFYFSFRNPAVVYPGNPASIRSDIGAAKLTLKDLTNAIVSTHEKGKAYPLASNEQNVRART